MNVAEAEALTHIRSEVSPHFGQPRNVRCHVTTGYARAFGKPLSAMFPGKTHKFREPR
jgi:hypothetical protein